MFQNIKNKELTTVFDCITDAMAVTVSDINKERAEQTFSDRTNRKSWYGLPDLKAVQSAIDTGWEDGANKVQTMSDSIVAPVPRNIKRRLKWSDSGDHIDMDKVYLGQMDNAWSSKPRMKGTGPRLITLAVCICANAHTESDELFWRGAGALKLAELLEGSGYMVRITAYQRSINTYPNGKKYKNRLDIITVKQPHERLNLQSIASTICLAGFFRWIGFKLLMSDDYKVDSGLGRANFELPAEFQGDHIVSKFHTINNKSKAVEFVNNALEKIQRGLI